MLDTDDADQPAWYEISDEQEQYIMDVLDKHKDVRWTFFMMHHPLWRRDNNQLEKIEAKLQSEGRKYTMFAGHVHRYMHNLRQGNHYYTLATTGGGSSLRGPQFGEFDHVTWVTVSEEGPVMANLWLDGILDMDIYNPKVDSLARALTQATQFEHLVLTNPSGPFSEGELLLKIENTATEPLHFKGQFFHHHHVNILNPSFEVEVPPGQTRQVRSDLLAGSHTHPGEEEPLELLWTVSFDSSEYDRLKLSGTYNIEVKPSETQFIEPEMSIFTEELEVNAPFNWEGLKYQYTLKDDSQNPTVPGFSLPVTIKQDNQHFSLRIMNQKGHATLPETRTFQKVAPRPALKAKKLKPGLRYRYYEGAWKKMPDFNSLKVLKKGIAENLTVKDLSPAMDHYGLEFEGYLTVPESGVYTFATYSDDGSFLFIGDEKVVDNDGSHSAKQEQGYIALEAGLHPIRIHYFEDHAGEVLKLLYKLPGETEFQEIPRTQFGYR